MTWLGALNFLVLQWFGVRLARHETSLTTQSGPWCVGLRVTTHDGAEAANWRVAAVNGTHLTLRRWQLLHWIVPLTGWWSDFVWIGRPK